MKTWNVTDADGTLSEAVLAALCRGPQRVTLDDEVDFVVLSEEEYARLAGETWSPNGTEAPESGEAAEAQTPVGSAQSPSSAGADQDRKWIWEWDEEAQRWALPWAKDVDPAEHPGLEFLNFMQNSPLAEAFREGRFTPEEWDAACRIGR
jgi:hypothetical protein